jgi:hypothetical protein
MALQNYAETNPKAGPKMYLTIDPNMTQNGFPKRYFSMSFYFFPGLGQDGSKMAPGCSQEAPRDAPWEPTEGPTGRPGGPGSLKVFKSLLQVL